MDYRSFDQLITINPLQSNITLEVELLSDRAVESFEQFSVFLEAVPALIGLVFIRQSPATIVLLNDDSEHMTTLALSHDYNSTVT